MKIFIFVQLQAYYKYYYYMTAIVQKWILLYKIRKNEVCI